MSANGGIHPRLRVKIAIGADQVGPGKARLLELIAAEGSISAAARSMGMGYRRAWHLLETLHHAVGTPVVDGARGGKGGGGASLTPVGRELLDAYRSVAESATESAATRLAALECVISDGPNP